MLLPLVLFIATCLSTFWVGAASWRPQLVEGTGGIQKIVTENWQQGLLYMGAVLAILLAGPGWEVWGAVKPSDRDERVEALLPEFRRNLAKFRRIFRSPGVVAAIVTPGRVHYVSSGRRRVGSAAPGVFPASVVASWTEPRAFRKPAPCAVTG